MVGYWGSFEDVPLTKMPNGFVKHVLSINADCYVQIIKGASDHFEEVTEFIPLLPCPPVPKLRIHSSRPKITLRPPRPRPKARMPPLSKALKP